MDLSKKEALELLRAAGYRRIAGIRQHDGTIVARVKGTFGHIVECPARTSERDSLIALLEQATS